MHFWFNSFALHLHMFWFNLNQNVSELGLFVHLSDIALTSFWMKLYTGFLSSLVSMHLITLGHCVYLHGWWWLARVVLIGGGRWLLYIKQGRPHPGNTRAGWAASADPQETAQLQIQSCDCGKCCLRLPLLSGPTKTLRLESSCCCYHRCHLVILFWWWDGRGREEGGRGAGGNVDARLHLGSMSSQWMQEKSSSIIIVVILSSLYEILKGSQWVCLCLQQKRRQRCM